MKGTYNIFNKSELGAQRIVLLENQVRNLNTSLVPFFLKGRLRTDRTAPVDSNDIQTPDLLYDWVIKDDYAYLVIDDSGDLKWRRITLDVF